jgi:hypothetical protein
MQFSDRFSSRPLFGPTAADRLLAGAESFEFRLYRTTDDEGRIHVENVFELRGQLLAGDADPADVLRSVARQLQLPRAQEGGDCGGDGAA